MNELAERDASTDELEAEINNSDIYLGEFKENEISSQNSSTCLFISDLSEDTSEV